MNESPIRILTEEFARQISRRRFLRRTVDVVFAGMAAVALEGIHFSRTAAASCEGQYSPGFCGCSLPLGGSCTAYDQRNCNGADCANGCVYSGCGGYSDSASCWCTDVCCYGSTSGYYICCDCLCSSHCCGCAQFVSTSGCSPDQPMAA